MFLKVFHILMVFQLLFSTTGVTVFEHLCQMRGRTAALYIQPKGCAQIQEGETTISACQLTGKHADSSSGFERKPCCEDKAQFVKSTTDAPAGQTFVIPDFDYSKFIGHTFLTSLPLDFIPLNQKILRFYLYKPPPVVTDIRVFIQSFLC